MIEKAQFFWAIVGDASPEPVAVVEENGKRVAYTIGCPDPFDLDEPEPNIELIPKTHFEWSTNEIKPMEIPPKPLERQLEREEREKRLERDAKRGIHHGWKRFNP